MRIISKFHDYYDIGMSHGHDETVTYVRDTKEIDVKDIAPIRKNRIREGCSYDFNIFGFCGRMIPMVTVSITKIVKGKAEYLTYYAYTVDDLLAVHRRYGFSDETTSRGWRTRRKTPNDLGRAVQFIEEQTDWKELEGLWHKHSTPVFWVPMVRRGWSDNITYEKKHYVINPVLSEFEFYKVLDPYTAYQEIDMFIGGVLANVENNMIEVDEQHRLTGHGYDQDSFRQPSGRKKSRRKNKK